MAILQATETFTRGLRRLNNSGTRAVIVERLQRVAAVSREMFDRWVMA
ncbi:hypothetical protein JLDANKMP_03830 [Stenotrophomonas sp. PE591]|nr:hypothetical protein [Stenotrophomonas sp. PE591]